MGAILEYECETCQAVLGPGMRFCPGCGERFASAVPGALPHRGPGSLPGPPLVLVTTPPVPTVSTEYLITLLDKKTRYKDPVVDRDGFECEITLKAQAVTLRAILGGYDPVDLLDEARAAEVLPVIKSAVRKLDRQLAGGLVDAAEAVPLRAALVELARWMTDFPLSRVDITEEFVGEMGSGTGSEADA